MWLNMFRVSVNPLGRSFGGKNPLKRVSKQERKLRKQVKQMKLKQLESFSTRFNLPLRALEEQVSGYMDINSELIRENEHVLHMNKQLRAQLARRQEVAVMDAQRIAQQAEKIQVLHEILRAVGYEA